MARIGDPAATRPKTGMSVTSLAAPPPVELAEAPKTAGNAAGLLRGRETTLLAEAGADGMPDLSTLSVRLLWSDRAMYPLR